MPSLSWHNSCKVNASTRCQRASHIIDRMSTSRAEELYRKYVKSLGKPPANASQLVAFSKKCGVSLSYVDATKYLRNLPKKGTSKPKEGGVSMGYGEGSEHRTFFPKKGSSIHSTEPQQKTTISRYSHLRREDLEREMDRLQKEIESLKKVTTFFYANKKRTPLSSSPSQYDINSSLLLCMATSACFVFCFPPLKLIAPFFCTLLLNRPRRVTNPKKHHRITQPFREKPWN